MTLNLIVNVFFVIFFAVKKIMLVIRKYFNRARAFFKKLFGYTV